MVGAPEWWPRSVCWVCVSDHLPEETVQSSAQTRRHRGEGHYHGEFSVSQQKRYHDDQSDSRLQASLGVCFLSVFERKVCSDFTRPSDSRILSALPVLNPLRRTDRIWVWFFPPLLPSSPPLRRIYPFISPQMNKWTLENPSSDAPHLHTWNTSRGFILKGFLSRKRLQVETEPQLWFL